MNPFEPIGPEVPPAPLEIPTPDFPKTNFQQIGADIATGAALAKDVGAWAKSILDLIAQAVGVIVGGLLGLVETVIAWFLRLLLKIFANAESGTDEIAATAVGGIFGVHVDPAAFQSVSDPTQRRLLASSLVGQITAALGAPFTGPNAQNIGPSADGANKFLQTALNMQIEGFMMGLIAEVVSLGHIEQIGELKDSLEHALGIGRMAQQVMRPAIKVFVRDPFTWLLNSTYFPTPLGVNVALKEYTRGQIDLPTLTTILGRAGIPQSQIGALVNDARPHVGASQLADLVNTGVIDQETALTELQAAGYDTATASWAYSAAQGAKLVSLSQQYVAAAEAAMVARKMDVATFNSIVDSFTQGLGGAGVGGGIVFTTANTSPIFSAAEGALLKATAFLKRGATMQLVPLNTAQQLFNLGLIDVSDFSELLVLHGYTNGQATIEQWSADVDAAIVAGSSVPWVSWWEILATTKEVDSVNAATAKANSAKARALAASAKLAKEQAAALNAAAIAEAKGVPVAKYEALVTDGLKTIAQYQDFLKGKGLAPDNVAAFTTVLQGKLNKAAIGAAATARVVGSSTPKRLSVAQLDAAVRAGFMDIPTYVSSLETLGYSAEDAGTLGEVLQHAMAIAQAKAATSTAAAAALGARKVSLAQEETAVILGLQTMPQYKAMLAAAGFDTPDVDILVGELQARVDAAAAAGAKRAATPAGARSRALSLTELERLIRAGVQPLSSYAPALKAAGYSDADAQSLVQLLQMVMDHDKHLEQATGKSNALLTAGGLSLGDLRTAVKLGVVPIAAYDAALSASGIAGSDAAVLHNALAAQLVTTAQTAGTVKRVNAALAPGGQSLTDLEAQVLNGSMTLTGFQSALTAAGISERDVADLVQLVTDMQAHGVAAGELLDRVTATAAARSINLSQESAAVKAGIQSIEDYQALVQRLGYDAADTAVLVATLADKLGLTPPADSATPPAA